MSYGGNDDADDATVAVMVAVAGQMFG